MSAGPLLRSGVLIRQPESDRRVGPDVSALRRPGLDRFAAFLGVPPRIKKAYARSSTTKGESRPARGRAQQGWKNTFSGVAHAKAAMEAREG